MRILVISDIHANVDALAAALLAAAAEGAGRIVSLGDVVGYNSLPAETIALMRSAGIEGVRGNHDLMVLGRIPPEGCGPRGRAAVRWTAPRLSPEDREYLDRLPDDLVIGDLLFIHSRLGDAVGRLRSPTDFREQREQIAARHPTVRVCFTGHTHEPAVIRVSPSGAVRPLRVQDISLDAGAFYFVNPGTIGEPRGSDDRAGFAVYDTEERRLAFRLAGYDRRRLLEENARNGLLPYVAPESRTLGTRVRSLVRRATSLVSARSA